MIAREKLKNTASEGAEFMNDDGRIMAVTYVPGGRSGSWAGVAYDTGRLLGGPARDRIFVETASVW